jgi:hypothetical protein
MMGLRTDSKCPLCQHGDHTLPRAAKTREWRRCTHHGTMLCRDRHEVHSEGQHGGCIVSADVGRKSSAEQTGYNGARARVAAAATARRDAGCPHRPAPEVETRRSAGQTTRKTEGPAQVYIVEIKTCIDAIQRPTRTRARNTDLANVDGSRPYGNDSTNPGGRYRHHLHRAHSSTHQARCHAHGLGLLPEHGGTSASYQAS